MPIQTNGLSPEVLKAALEGLEAQRQRIEQHIESVRSMLGQRGPGRRPKSVRPNSTGTNNVQAGRKRRKLSATARKRIAEAQRKRWAAVRQAKASPAPAKKKAAGKKAA